MTDHDTDAAALDADYATYAATLDDEDRAIAAALRNRRRTIRRFERLEATGAYTSATPTDDPTEALWRLYGALAGPDGMDAGMRARWETALDTAREWRHGPNAAGNGSDARVAPEPPAAGAPPSPDPS